MRMRKKKNLELRMERCSALMEPQPVEVRGRWREKMPQAKAVHLELGCGKGRFTCEMAAGHPDTLFIAVERVRDAMIIAMERAAGAGLSNLCFIDGDAARLETYFAPGEIDRVYVNFCDPWPSHRHAPRRLIHVDFLRRYRAILAPGGAIWFKTDNADLFEYALFQFPKVGFALREVTRDLHGEGVSGVMTDYEEKFYNMGLPIHRCVAVDAGLPQEEVDGHGAL